MCTHETRIRLLKTRWQKGMGAMLRGQLGTQVLVFVYEQPASRIFHTFLCAPLRILTLTDEGLRISDEIFPPNQLVRLPLTRLIVECDPEHELTESDLRSIAALAEFL